MEDGKSNQFYGLSTLRAKEKEKQPKSEQAKAMADYLKKYNDGPANGEFRVAQSRSCGKMGWVCNGKNPLHLDVSTSCTHAICGIDLSQS